MTPPKLKETTSYETVTSG